MGLLCCRNIAAWVGIPVLILCMLSSISLQAQEDDPKKEAYEYAKKGLDLTNKGKFDEAIEAYEKGYALDPENSGFQYEIAVVYYLKKDYRKTIQIMEKLLNAPDANDQYFQILGNAYDLEKQTSKARRTYAAGIKRFPESGVLYMESGVLEYMKKNTADAVRYWESGINANPGFTSNYFWLARYYASTTEKVWAVLYAEMFINLERNTERTQEISELIYNTYKQGIHADSSGLLVDLTKSIAVNPQPDMALPFEQVFQQCMQQAADSLMKQNPDSISYTEICRIRELFLHFWFAEKMDSVYPNVLFSWLHDFPEAGYLESYHRWLFLKGNESAFESWYYSGPEPYNAFVGWFRKNPLKISSDNYFSRSKY